MEFLRTILFQLLGPTFSKFGCYFFTYWLLQWTKLMFMLFCKILITVKASTFWDLILSQQALRLACNWGWGCFKGPPPPWSSVHVDVFTWKYKLFFCYNNLLFCCVYFYRHVVSKEIYSSACPVMKLQNHHTVWGKTWLRFKQVMV